MRSGSAGADRGRRRRLPLATLLLAATPACAGQEDGGVAGEWRAEREQRGDTFVVRTLAGSVWGDTLAVVPELAIGELEHADEAYLFGSIRGLDVDAAGRIYVVDGQTREVRVFSPAGAHLRTMGRAGGGPGEFRGPDHVRALRDGSVVVRDQAGGGFTVFAADGSYDTSWRWQSGFSTSATFFLDADDRVINPTLRDRLVRYDARGAPLDTIPVPTRGYQPPRLEVVMEGGGRATYSIAFMPSESWTITRDGRVLFGRTDQYAIERHDPDGRVLRVERSVEPVRVEPGEAAQARTGTTRAIRGANDPAWRWQGPDVPSTKPHFRFVVGGIDGTIWVFRSMPGTEQPNPAWDPERPDRGFPTRWYTPVVADVFDADGRFLGPVRLPDGVGLLPPPVLSADRIWAVMPHELGHVQVVRFSVAHE
jgi:hypothetical protein